jgi:hypothetical protein
MKLWNKFKVRIIAIWRIFTHKRFYVVNNNKKNYAFLGDITDKFLVDTSFQLFQVGSKLVTDNRKKMIDNQISNALLDEIKNILNEDNDE